MTQTKTTIIPPIPTMQVAIQLNSAAGLEEVALASRANKAKQKLDAAKQKAEAEENAPPPQTKV
jgi:hypothetical protein